MLNNNNYRDGRWSGRAQGVEVSPEPPPGALCALSPALAGEAEPRCGVPRREQVGSQPPASVSLSQKRALRRPRPGQGRYGNAGPQQSHPAVPAPSCRDRALRCQAWGRARTLGRVGRASSVLWRSSPRWCTRLRPKALGEPGRPDIRGVCAPVCPGGSCPAPPPVRGSPEQIQRPKQAGKGQRLFCQDAKTKQQNLEVKPTSHPLFSFPGGYWTPLRI